MSDLGWFAAFALILLLMVFISLWMAWYSRRAMRSHKGQIEDMIREMKGVIEEERDVAEEGRDHAEKSLGGAEKEPPGGAPQ